MLVRGHLAADQRPEGLERALAVRLVAEVSHGHPNQLAPFVAQHQVEGGIGLPERAVDVDHDDAQRSAFEDRPETCFGAREGDLRLHPFRLITQG